MSHDRERLVPIRRREDLVTGSLEMLCESHSELQLIVAQENGGHNSYAASRAARQRFGQLPAPQIKQKTVARNPISAPRFADRGAGFQPTSRAVARPRFSLQLEAIKQHNRPTATWQPASRQIGVSGLGR